MHTSSTIVDLRKLLATRFPHLRQSAAVDAMGASLSTGVPALDRVLGGGLPRGEMTELIARGHGSGSAEVIHELLQVVATNRQFLALVDGKGSFDPEPVDAAVLKRLLWIRCRDAAEALKAMDLLLRDRNFPILVLDLKINPARELRKIPASTWYRYDRLLEQNQSTVLAITPQQLVSGAAARVVVESGLGMDTLVRPRAELLSSLRFRSLRSAAEGRKRDLLAQAG